MEKLRLKSAVSAKKDEEGRKNASGKKYEQQRKQAGREVEKRKL